MVDSPFFSNQWHRMRDAKPTLVDDLQIAHHYYRGRPITVLKRAGSVSSYYLDTTVYRLIAELDGEMTLDQFWQNTIDRNLTNVPTQATLMALFADLHFAELLNLQRRESEEQIFDRRRKHLKSERKEKLANPFYLRFSLFNPARLLVKLDGLAHLVFSRSAAVTWCVLLLIGLSLLFYNSDRLADQLMSPQFPSASMLLLMALLYPFVKVLHELGHALAVKRFGGTVHECGIAIMVLMPVPFVNASEATLFADKRHRMTVDAAGILVEVFIASVGVVLWSVSEGYLSSIGLALFLIGGLSTILVNGNPLMRFDGYYLLADWLEIPNLGTRGKQAVKSWLKWRICGIANADTVSEDSAEKIWLKLYGCLAGVWRCLLMLSIAYWVYGKYPLIGVCLAVIAIYYGLLQPVQKLLVAIYEDEQLRSVRSLSVILGIPLFLLTTACSIPLPNYSNINGVVWLPDHSVIRASNDCTVTDQHMTRGTWVSVDQALITCTDEEMLLQQRALESTAKELNARSIGLATADPVQYKRVEAHVIANNNEQKNLKELIKDQTLRAGTDGAFDTADVKNLKGRFFARGEVLGYVIPDQGRTIRVGVNERELGKIDKSLLSVEMMIPDTSFFRVYHTEVITRTPRPGFELLSTTLSRALGDDRARSSADRATSPVTEIELAWPEQAPITRIGSQVLVRFVHKPEPLSDQLIAMLHELSFGKTARGVP